MTSYERTHTCAVLRKKDIGNSVTLSGWVDRRRDHGGLIFIDLRDRFGITQLVFNPEKEPEPHKQAETLRSEWVISIQGTVISRSEGMDNPNMATGEIEIEVETLSILSEAKTPPFSICDETIATNEELKLTYRYLDIRRGIISRNLEMRHKASLAIRNYLNNANFLEITTPILSKSTPEGARDYLVPSRVHPKSFYALPQSPQLFKQLLMVSGMDRYFQIATCFRDEDLRADRQPEFTQVDIEMSFSSPETLLPLIENLLQKLFQECLGIAISPSFQKLTHSECMEKYGTDRPDLRFEMPLVRISSLIEESNFSILKEEIAQGGIVKALCIKGGATFSRREIDELITFSQKFGLSGLAWMKHQKEGFTSSIVKFFSKELLSTLGEKLQSEENDLILIGAGPEDRVNQSLDHLRRHIAKKQGLTKPDQFSFLWVTEFPLFEFDTNEKRLVSAHHPFTAPLEEDLPLLLTDPLKVRSQAYDIVINGYEVGGGSQRIHDGALQKKIFEALKLSPEEIEEKFSFFIEALQYGTPPHLGIALGLDRLIMLLCKTEHIRDVIAFPKTQRATDLMMQSPSPIGKKQLTEVHLTTI